MKKDCFEDIYNSYLEKKMAQAFLLQTNNVNKCLHDLIELIYKIMPLDNINFENITNNFVPNVIFIEPDGQNIKKDQIIELKNKFLSKPIFGEFNIYIINYAEKMNDVTSNKMLKFVEEPENNILGFFICEDLNSIIPTIKSRCQINHVIYSFDSNDDYFMENIAKNEEFYAQTLDYINAIENKDENIILYNKVHFEKKNKNDIIQLINYMLGIYKRYLQFITIKKVCDPRITKILCNQEKAELVRKIEILVSKSNILEYNINSNLFLDSLVLEMRNEYE